jgi:hypothetical protein
MAQFSEVLAKKTLDTVKGTASDLVQGVKQAIVPRFIQSASDFISEVRKEVEEANKKQEKEQKEQTKQEKKQSQYLGDSNKWLTQLAKDTRIMREKIARDDKFAEENANEKRLLDEKMLSTLEDIRDSLDGGGAGGGGAGGGAGGGGDTNIIPIGGLGGLARAAGRLIRHPVFLAALGAAGILGAARAAAGGGPRPGPSSGPSGNMESLRDLIAGGEAGPAGYNAYNMRDENGKAKAGLTGPPMNLEAMTVQQVMTLQENKGPGGLFAAGRYQVIPSTLAENVREMGIDPSKTKFDKTFQDQLFNKILPETTKRYFAGDKSVTKEQAQIDLAKKWAAVPMPGTGDSYHKDVAGNKAKINQSSIDAVFESLRQSGIQSAQKEGDLRRSIDKLEVSRRTAMLDLRGINGPGEKDKYGNYGLETQEKILQDQLNKETDPAKKEITQKRLKDVQDKIFLRQYELQEIDAQQSDLQSQITRNGVRRGSETGQRATAERMAAQQPMSPEDKITKKEKLRAAILAAVAVKRARIPNYSDTNRGGLIRLVGVNRDPEPVRRGMVGGSTAALEGAIASAMSGGSGTTVPLAGKSLTERLVDSNEATADHTRELAKFARQAESGGPIGFRNIAGVAVPTSRGVSVAKRKLSDEEKRQKFFDDRFQRLIKTTGNITKNLISSELNKLFFPRGQTGVSRAQGAQDGFLAGVAGRELKLGQKSTQFLSKIFGKKVGRAYGGVAGEALGLGIEKFAGSVGSLAILSKVSTWGRF